MNILEAAFAKHSAEQVEVLSRFPLLTPCGVSYTTEPMYNLATKLHDSVMYVFESGEKIIVDDSVDSFQDAYVEYMASKQV
jgi:hypothetical protein